MPGAGWLLLAAMAVPIIVRSAKPLAKKIGEGLKTAGEKLIEATEQESAAEEPKAPESKDEKAKTQAKAAPAAKKPAKPRARKPAAKRTPKAPAEAPKEPA